MFIKTEDFNYLQTLLSGLGEESKKRFLGILSKVSGGAEGEAIKKIKVVDDSIRDRQGIMEGDFITRTTIKKAYKQAKEGK